MKHYPGFVWSCCSVVLITAASLSLYGCSDVSKAPPPPPGPDALTILTTSPLPDATVNQPYNVALAASGGTPGYTWSLAAGSPPLPAGLSLNTTGIISGTPTTVTPIGAPVDLVIQAVDSGSSAQGTQQTAKKTLSITVNPTPIPLQIVTSSLPSGTINTSYFAALSGNGGITPYTWGLKSGSNPLPSGISLDPSTGFISGTPVVTSNTSHTFTLKDAVFTTVEKTLTLTISAVPLSITTTSLPQGTANQNYSAQLSATGGTGTKTWSLAGGSPPLPSGLTLHASSGVIDGIPTTTSSQTHTFAVTDQTLPIPQTVTKSLQLIIGAAPPTLTITTSSPLPSGTVTVPYSVTLNASGGTGGKTWDIQSGSLPAGLNLSSSGAISGTPVTTGTTAPTIRVRDSGNPQQTATKQLSITINNPAPPKITTTSLPNGSFNQGYNQTLGVSGGIPPLTWGVIAGGLPNGLSLNSSNGTISGTATATGTFNFTVRVTDAIPQFDDQALSIIITAPPPPNITTTSLPIGTVNVPYPPTTLNATGGASPLTWQPVGLPFGLTFTAATATISGTPTSSGSQNVTFTVNDATAPINQTDSQVLTLTVHAALTINTNSPLPAGTVDQPYGSVQLAASGGTPPYTWSIPGGPSTPAPGLLLSSGGAISGTPTIQGSFSRTYRVQDNNGVAVTKPLTIQVNGALTIDNNPLPAAKVGDAYSAMLTASGGTPPYGNWGVSPPLPPSLSLDPSTGAITGTPDLGTDGTASYTFSVQDSNSGSANRSLSLTINP